MINRNDERFIRRLETEFSSSGGTLHRGISSDLSMGGLFIRTHHGLAPGSVIDITVYLPDGKPSKLRGIVRRTMKAGLDIVKNGMGVELISKDSEYINFINSYTGTDFLIVTCSSCGVKNKVPKDKLSLGPKCGNCKASLRAA